MPRVRNLETGLEHTVQPGHFSLSQPEKYRVLPDEPKVEPKARKGKRKE